MPFQQAPNFVDGTVDALLFLLSNPTTGYVPGGWTASDAETHRSSAAGAGLSWTNPLWSVVDPARVGLAGHSLGASAVSVVAQCSDRSTRWQAVPTCLGRSFPIRAVVGWDRLHAGADVVPVVPGMDQEADGYFVNPRRRRAAVACQLPLRPLPLGVQLPLRGRPAPGDGARRAGARRPLPGRRLGRRQRRPRRGAPGRLATFTRGRRRGASCPRGGGGRRRGGGW